MRRKHTTALVTIILLAFIPASSFAVEAFKLLDDVAGNDERARARARQLLPREDVEVVPKLVALLGSTNDQIRLTTFNVLADFANQVSVPGREADRSRVTASLMTLLAGDSPGKLKELGLRLLALVVAEGTDIGPIAALLNDAELQEKARAALVEMGTAEARAALREQIDKAKPEFACALLDGLAQLKDAAGLETVMACTKSEHASVRAAAARALAWTGDPSHLPVVEQVMAACDDATRSDATDAWLRLVRAIETSGGNWQVAVDEYRGMLGSADAKVRMAGFGGLGRMGDGTCVSPLLSAIGKSERVEWAAGLEALRQMRGVDVCREIANAYSSEPAPTQLALLPILGGKQHALAMPVLVEAAASSHAAFRAAALAALGDVALPEAVKPLASACKSAGTQEQAIARAALVRLGDALRAAGGKHAAAAGGAYLAALAGVSEGDQDARRRAVAGLTASPSAEAYEVAKAVAADAELRDLALPLLVGVGDRLAAAKNKERALELYRTAIELKPDTTTLRGLADKMLKLGSPIDWAARLGIVRHWYVVGPFDLGEQNVGWTKPYVDEPNVDLKGRYMSGKRRHEWRPVVADDERGVVNMAAALGQVDGAIGYAYAEIEVPAETDAVLRIGVDDSEKVWVNGVQVFELWVARALTIDQDKVPVKLKAGRNTILMKIWQNTLGWEFCVRVTTPDDKPISFTQKPPQ